MKRDRVLRSKRDQTRKSGFCIFAFRSSSALASLLFAATAAHAGGVALREAQAPLIHEPLLKTPIPNAPGKIFVSLIVDLPTGASAAPHVHSGSFVYAYVLAGAVRNMFDERPPRVYRQGESWTESPGARHLIFENASDLEPAKMLVVLIVDEGAPIKVEDIPPQ